MYYFRFVAVNNALKEQHSGDDFLLVSPLVVKFDASMFKANKTTFSRYHKKEVSVTIEDTVT